MQQQPNSVGGPKLLELIAEMLSDERLEDFIEYAIKKEEYEFCAILKKEKDRRQGKGDNEK